ncbi:ABC-three component system middle component 6 [Streptococcus pneumoniae]|uniref:ABC-three component system middle component 6 n=2 Tax=Streptococcus pneumoniae TaxID=1313 RepID=UPI001CD985B6|nr:ABC-three component system middle component 6 [Streptococcus pneumoniae]
MMLLLDKNAEPKKTIFYLSAIVHGLILKRIVNIENLYIELQKEIEDELNYDFFILALDFLFLLDKIRVNNEGDIENVH